MLRPRFALAIALACLAPLAAQILPRPHEIDTRDTPILLAHPRIVCQAQEFRPQAEVLTKALAALGVRLQHETADGATTITIRRAALAPGSTYQIHVGASEVTLEAESTAGMAHAAASLLQAIEVADGGIRCSIRTIADGPEHAFRCFMVDMGRNPHSPATLRQVVDMMWFYKGNYLQLHLSDDQLFSWPSKAFPKLQSKNAGWTLQDFVELEAYSQARGVTIIPELDVPGHSTILRRCYPEVFGKTPTDLAKTPAAQAGVETLLGEMLAVFRATPYVHVGGDEAYGVPQDLQRDFINRLNRFVRKNGRRTVVWEGPHLGKGDNKIATDVLHVNWRTIDFPAQAMLDAGYEVVNAAWDPHYVVDHYPRTMFTAVPVKRCYDWDKTRFAHINHGMRTFARPHRTTTGKGIVGFCMPWWEGREHNLIPLCLDRFAALASAAWNRAGENDFAGFERRQQRAIAILQKISAIRIPPMRFADPATQTTNLAFRARVTPARGASQPHFGPARLTNGIPDRFDHFLGFPTKPTPLQIVLELREPAEIGRVVVYETAVGKSHEIYRLFASADGVTYERIGASKKGTRGESDHVTHTFAPRTVRYLKIETDGCHGLTFPSFSRLTEVMAFAQ